MPITKPYRDFNAYLVAHQRAYAWADKAIQFRSAGKFWQAKAAVEMVNHWLRYVALPVPKTRVTRQQTRAKRAIK
jgi:hypothetical protein